MSLYDFLSKVANNTMNATGDGNRMVQNTGEGVNLNLGDTIVHGGQNIQYHQYGPNSSPGNSRINHAVLL